MSIPLPNSIQYECRNEIMEVYASDRRGIIEYKFNNLGYRNNIDYINRKQPIGAYIGSSITSAIGVPWKDGFCYLSAEKLSVEPWNFSQGCTYIDNGITLEMIKSLLKSDLNIKYWIIQFVDFDRRDLSPANNSTDLEENSKQFLNIFNQIENLLEDKTWCFLCTDSKNHSVPENIKKHPKCVAWNFPFVDLAGVGSHPGKKWHSIMSAGIVKKINQ